MKRDVRRLDHYLIRIMIDHHRCFMTRLDLIIIDGETSLSSKGTCGALVGGMLAISSIFGREYDDFKDGKKKRRIFKYAKILYDRFVDEYDSPLCCDVQKKIFGRSFNLMDSIEYEEFEKAGAHVDKCPTVLGNAARWTVEIILNEMKK